MNSSEISKSEKSYTPINCNFHDMLLEKATRKEICQISYVEAGDTVQVSAVIVDVFTRKGAEYMTLDNGSEIRLDQIRSVGKEKMP